MNNMKLILIDDDDQEARSCSGALQDFNEDNQCDIQLEIHKTIQSALNALERSYFDGAIIDMKLGDSGIEGNQALDVIRQHLKRIPVAIYTATPDVADDEDGIPLIGVFKKGDKEYKDIIHKFYDIYKTGLTKIMGGKGEIEQSLSQIFIKHLLPKISPEPTVSEKSNWVCYAEEKPDDTEKALLRHTLNHLIHELYKSSDNCYPEEMYIHLLPRQDQTEIRIDTGCILKEKNQNKFYIVLSPACDLVERGNDKCNTDRALLVEIQILDELLNDSGHKIFNDDCFIDNICGNKKIKKILPKNSSPEEGYLSKNKSEELKIFKQNKKNYYHWLPSTCYFNNGAVINFRRVSTYSQEELDNSFNSPVIQVASPFLKDIISRFSSYYARQGQPDINVMI